MKIQKKRHKAKKSLGQNFLKSFSFAYQLVNAAEVGEDDIIVEVGPGKGMITKILLQKAKHVIAVEKDDGLYEFLENKFVDEIEQGTLKLIHGDILDFDPSDYKLTAGQYKLIGSIPYNITGILIRTFLTIEEQPQSISFIIQKEVAQRIVARDGKESLLSISVKVYGEPRYVKSIKAREFSPKPKVDSAIFIINAISRNFFSPQGRDKGISEEKFFTIVKTGFSSKRKKVIGNLTSLFAREDLLDVFKENDISPNARAENLTPHDWKNIVYTLF